MKKYTIKDIKTLASLVFDTDKDYDKFVYLFNNQEYNGARLFLTDCDGVVESDAYSELEDVLIDLIINEIDGEGRREFKQTVESTGW